MASNVHLLNCSGVVVNADVENFIGIGLTNVVIDYTYSNTVWNGSDTPLVKTASFSVDRSYHNKTIYLDATGGDITITWDCALYAGLKVTFIRTDATSHNIIITDVGSIGTETFIGEALPYIVTLYQYDVLPITSYSDTIYIAK